MLKRQAFKFELRTNQQTATVFRQFAGCKRYVYNCSLALNEKMYKLVGKKHTRFQLDKLLPIWKKEQSWLADAPSHVLQQALIDLESAYQKFFDAVKAGHRVAPKDKKLRKILQKRKVPLAYPPTFKKKGKHESFRYPDGFKVDAKFGRVWLPKLGWIRYRKSRVVVGTPKNLTISESCGRWFVSITAEQEIESPVHPHFDSDIAIDMGVTVFATMSNETTSILPDTKKIERRKKFLQRQLRHKKQFSKNWKKLQAKIAKKDKTIANIRQDHRHKLTDTLTKNHGTVFGDDLDVRNMTKSAKGTAEKHGKNVAQKSGLNRSLLAQGIGEVNRQLQYKLHWRGGLYIPCPPAYGSQHCPSCGHIDKENRKTQSLFLCVECGFSANADYVAAVNKLEAGRAFLACGDFPSWTRFGKSGKNSVKQEELATTHGCL